MSNRKKILWLASWYPNKKDAFDGDFIQRHARAAALHHDVHVVWVGEGDGDRSEEVSNRATGLTEQWIYTAKSSGPLRALTRQWLWRRAFLDAVQRYIVAHGRPDLVHVHVPWKAGLIALELKARWALPYLVTEHWGIYNHTVADNIGTRPKFFQLALAQVYQRASGFITVSRFLGEGVNRMVTRRSFEVIPNVVDTSLFFPGREQYERFSFIHISNMVSLKNVDGILEAFAAFSKEREDVQLVLVGNRNQYYHERAAAMGLLNRSVFFRGEIPYREVARELQRSHCLVVNSDMENSPCVIGEALCCGVPVIATDVGGIPELVDASNSLLVQPRNGEDLLRALRAMVDGYHGYDRESIAQAARERFGYAAVGARFNALYSRFPAPAGPISTPA